MNMNYKQCHWDDLVTCYEEAVDLRLQLAGEYWKTYAFPINFAFGKYCTSEKLKALELIPNLAQAETHNKLAAMFLAQENIDEAIWSYTRSIIVDPEHNLAYMRLEELLFEQSILNALLSQQDFTGRIFPTFHGHKDNLKDMAQSLQNNGCILIRNAFSYSEIKQACDAIKDFYEFLEKCKNGSQKYIIPAYYQFNYSKNSMSIYPFHEDRNWDNSVLKQFISSNLLELMNLSLGSKFFFELQASRVRKHTDYKQKPTILPYHQDGTVVKVREQRIVSGRETKMFTCFVPLTSCGLDSPSLELIPIKFKWLFPKTILPRVLASIENSFVDSQLWHPQLEVGDVLVFDAMSIHRTYLTELMNRERISMDIRIFSYSN